MHEPSLRQQAPRHGLGLHGTPTPMNTPPFWRQFCCVRMTQNTTPGSSKMQQAPEIGCGQLFGTQVLPTPWSVSPGAHASVMLAT